MTSTTRFLRDDGGGVAVDWLILSVGILALGFVVVLEVYEAVPEL